MHLPSAITGSRDTQLSVAARALSAIRDRRAGSGVSSNASREAPPADPPSPPDSARAPAWSKGSGSGREARDEASSLSSAFQSSSQSDHGPQAWAPPDESAAASVGHPPPSLLTHRQPLRQLSDRFAGAGDKTPRPLTRAASPDPWAPSWPALAPREALGLGSSAVHMATSVLGAGMLGLPYCFRLCGALLSPLLLCGVAVATVGSMRLLLSSAALVARDGYADVAAASAGPWAALAVVLCLLVVDASNLVAYLNILADCAGTAAGGVVPPGAEPSREASLLLVTLLALILALLCARRQHLQRATAAAGSLFLCACSVPALWVASRRWSDGAGLGLWRPEGLALAVPVVVYGFTAHHLLFPAAGGLRAPSLGRAQTLVHRAVALVAAVNGAVGLGGYAAFGEEAAGDVLRNLGGGGFERALRAGYGLCILGVLPGTALTFAASLQRLAEVGASGADGGGPARAGGLPGGRPEAEAAKDEEGVGLPARTLERTRSSLGSGAWKGEDADAASSDATLHQPSAAPGDWPGRPSSAARVKPGALLLRHAPASQGLFSTVFAGALLPPAPHALSCAPAHLNYLSLLSAIVLGALGAAVLPNVEFVFGLVGSTASVLLGFILPGLIYLAASAQHRPPPGALDASRLAQRARGRRRRAAWALVALGLLLGVPCTGVLLKAAQEEAEVVALARALAREQARVDAAGEARAEAEEALGAADALQRAMRTIDDARDSAGRASSAVEGVARRREAEQRNRSAEGERRAEDGARGEEAAGDDAGSDSGGKRGTPSPPRPAESAVARASDVGVRTVQEAGATLRRQSAGGTEAAEAQSTLKEVALELERTESGLRGEADSLEREGDEAESERAHRAGQEAIQGAHVAADRPPALRDGTSDEGAHAAAGRGDQGVQLVARKGGGDGGEAKTSTAASSRRGEAGTRGKGISEAGVAEKAPPSPKHASPSPRPSQRAAEEALRAAALTANATLAAVRESQQAVVVAEAVQRRADGEDTGRGTHQGLAVDAVDAARSRRQGAGGKAEEDRGAEERGEKADLTKAAIGLQNQEAAEATAALERAEKAVRQAGERLEATSDELRRLESARRDEVARSLERLARVREEDPEAEAEAAVGRRGAARHKKGAEGGEAEEEGGKTADSKDDGAAARVHEKGAGGEEGAHKQTLEEQLDKQSPAKGQAGKRETAPEDPELHAAISAVRSASQNVSATINSTQILLAAARLEKDIVEDAKLNAEENVAKHKAGISKRALEVARALSKSSPSNATSVQHEQEGKPRQGKDKAGRTDILTNANADASGDGTAKVGNTAQGQHAGETDKADVAARHRKR